MKKAALLFTLISLSTYTTQAQFTIGNTPVDTIILAKNLNTPWEMVYTIDSSLWFTERIGKVSRIDLNSRRIKLVLDLQHIVEQQNESGLLGMEILEDSTSSTVFLVYTYLDVNNTFFERLVSFEYDRIQDTLINETILIDSIPAFRIHDGSRLELVDDHLFMTTGDAADLTLPQDLNSLAGKVLRINTDGSIPIDNPIPGSFIYSWGHRNAQGLFFANDLLYSSEHGPSTDDEINIIEKGRNYGWPDVKGFCDSASDSIFCNDSNVVEPLINWTPTVATSQILYYDHPAILEWQGALLLTTLKASKIIALEMNTNRDSILSETDFFTNTWGRLRSITTDPDGNIYLATNSNSNRIIRLSNANLTALKQVKSNDPQLILWPNPAVDQLSIKIESYQLNPFNISLFSLDGKKIFDDVLSDNQLLIDVSNYAKGVYILQLDNQIGHSITRKVVIQ